MILSCQIILKTHFIQIAPKNDWEYHKAPKAMFISVLPTMTSPKFSKDIFVKKVHFLYLCFLKERK